jgi:hypothetical protein
MEEFKDKELFVELTPEELEELKGGVQVSTFLGEPQPQPSITGLFLSKPFTLFPIGIPAPLFLKQNIHRF